MGVIITDPLQYRKEVNFRHKLYRASFKLFDGVNHFSFFS